MGAARAVEDWCGWMVVGEVHPPSLDAEHPLAMALDARLNSDARMNGVRQNASRGRGTLHSGRCRIAERRCVVSTS
jgi:hypothetical protein